MSEEKSGGLGVPAAIIIAGGLIAIAIYTSNGGGRQIAQDVDIKPVDAPAGAVAGEQEPPQPQIGEIREVSDIDHVRGRADAPITVIEYSDLECPFCAQVHPTMQQLVDDNSGQVKWVFRHFPLGIHPGAPKKAEASECAGEQGKFWEFTDALFEAGTQVPVTGLADIARSAGVPNISQWQSCLDSGKFTQKVEDDTADATAAGGRGTPHAVILGPEEGQQEVVSGAQPIQAFQAAVDRFSS